MSSDLGTSLETDDRGGEGVARRLAEAWYRRATVRTGFESAHWLEPYDLSMPDYPMSLLPFSDDPRFADAEPSKKQQVLTMAWLVYNERVIAAEEQVAVPTFAELTSGNAASVLGFQMQRALQQSYLDEVWHTYLHTMAMQRTRQHRKLFDQPTFPSTVTLRRLKQALAETGAEWQRRLLRLAWTTVAEVSVNAYLSLLSEDKTIQPLHSLVPRLHARDESAHSSIMIEACKAVCFDMTKSERGFFVEKLPLATTAFTVHDFAVWPIILRHAGIADASDIVEDCSRRAQGHSLVRDFSGMRRLARELDIDLSLNA